MSNKAYAWLTAIVAVVVILLVLLLPHMKEIIAAWLVIKIILIGLVVVIVAAAFYNYIWHPVHSKVLGLSATKHEIKRANSELEHRKQVELQTIELNKLKEANEHIRQLLALRNPVLNAGQTLINMERED